MGIGDGSVIGAVRIVDHGSDADRWTMVLVAEGYQAGQLAQFHTDAQNFVNTLFTTPPFTSLQAAVNVYRLDVSSTDSGADDPAACGGTGATARTYFDASFCNSGIRRLLEVDAASVLNVVNTHVAQWNMIMVLVNSTVYGGSGGAVAVFSMASGATEIGLHEMGHTAFGFADEYESWAGCGVDTNRNNHPAVEPSEPNVTINSNRSTIKWGDLIAAVTPVPTTHNSDCTVCDPQPNPFAATTVGAYEGAHYYHCGAYRPQFTCRMRALGNPYCAVCQRVITRTLTPHLPHKGILKEKIEIKDHKLEKVERKEFKEFKLEKLEKVEIKEFKVEKSEIKDLEKPPKEFIEKPAKEIAEKPGERGGDPAEMEARIAQLEATVQGLTHFITSGQRPDLSRGALTDEPDMPAR